MADETWPSDIVPWSQDFYLQTNTTVFDAPVTHKRRTLRRQGRRWMCEMQLRAVRADAQRADALFDRLAGPAGTVKLWDFDRERPLGPNLDRESIGDTDFDDDTGFDDDTDFDGGAAGILVFGTWLVGSTQVLADGFPQNTTQLLEGDYVELGGYLYRIVADAEADELGRAYLTLNRALLTEIPHLEPVVRTRAGSPFALVDDDQARKSRRVGDIDSYQISLVEVLP